MDQAIARDFENYLANSNSAICITESEARRLGGQTAARYVTLESDEAKLIESGDKYLAFGEAALTIEKAFTRMIANHNIRYFTGYRVTQIPCLHGTTFKVETIVV